LKKILSILLISVGFAFTSIHAFTFIDVKKELNSSGDFTSTLNSQNHIIGDLELVSGKETAPNINSLFKTLFGTNAAVQNFSPEFNCLNTKAANAFLFLERFLSHIYPFHAFW